MSDLRASIKETVRRLAMRTSVDQLRRKGVQKINVLGLDRIVHLIEEAVRRSLKDRMLGLERDQIAASAREEFVQLLRSNEDLQRSKQELERQMQEAEEEVERVRHELRQEREALRAKLEEAAQVRRSAMESEDQELAGRVQEVFQQCASGGGDLVELQERVVALFAERIGDERRAALAAREALHDSEVDKLERRIHKLTQSLQSTERRLDEVAAGGRTEEGIASVYREVQGLRAGEAQFQRKRELMESIFEANLRIQKGAV